MHSWYPQTEFVSLRLQTNFMGGEWSIPESEARVGWYGVTGYPTVVWVGTIWNVGAAPAHATGEPYRDVFLSLKGPSPYKLDVENFDAMGGSFDVRLEIMSDPGPTTGLMIQSWIEEDGLVDIHGDTHYQVGRMELPAEPLTARNVGEVQTFTRTFVRGPGWNVNNINAIAWIQTRTAAPQGDPSLNIPQAATSYPKSTYGLNYYNGQLIYFVPVGSPTSFDDIVMFNTGSETDGYNARIVDVNVPPGWAAELDDGTTTGQTLTTTLASAESYPFHATVTPTSVGYATYGVEMWQDALPNDIKTVEVTLLTAGLPILVVDDDGGQDYEDYYTDALDDGGYKYGMWPRSAMELPDGMLEEFCIVMWNLGWQSPHLTQSDQDALGAYLDNGGKLFISGQDLGWDMVENVGGTDAAWYAEYMHSTYVMDDTNELSIIGIAADPIGDGLSFNITNAAPGDDGADNQEYPSEIARRDGQTSNIFQYPGFMNAAVKVDTGTYKVVYFAFGYEAIDSAANRNLIMQRIVEWLELCDTGCITPGALTDVTVVKGAGTDMVLDWAGDINADSNAIYTTDDKTIIGNLRGDGGCPDCTPVANGMPPVTYTNGVTEGLMYYQVLGACGGTEGPN